MKILYIIYQFLIAWPLVVVATLFTAIFTILCFPWKNGAVPHTIQVMCHVVFFGSCWYLSK